MSGHVLTADSPLTERQRDVLVLIVEHLRHHGYPPTLRAIAAEMGGMSTNAVRDHLIALEKRRYIDRTAKAWRGIRLLRGLDGRPVAASCPTCGHAAPSGGAA